MSSQRYVYTTHGIGAERGKIGDIESVISEYARQGWRLILPAVTSRKNSAHRRAEYLHVLTAGSISETLVSDGTTVGLVFEREVESDS